MREPRNEGEEHSILWSLIAMLAGVTLWTILIWGAVEGWRHVGR